jgi:hypothetical protein
MGLVEDVQMYLQSLSPGIIDGSTGWPSSRRRVHDGLGHRLVIITEDGGFEPETPSPDGIGDSALMEPAVQVRVRGTPWDTDAVEEKAAEIFDVLHGLLRTTMGYTYYERVKAQTTPIFIGFDDKGRPEITTSYRALRAVVSTS